VVVCHQRRDDAVEPQLVVGVRWLAEASHDVPFGDHELHGCPRALQQPEQRAQLELEIVVTGWLPTQQLEDPLPVEQPE
jgi:hypothetical protein